MSSIQAPKGTIDLLPDATPKWRAIERIARETAELYHFGEIRTPIFEHSELFHRGVGETSDIVSKETYTFADRDNRSITLRPEGTAGVVRAVIENGLINDAGARAKVFYIGANFRYERPAAGRYRVHHQFGVEAFGIAEPEQDVECILLQMDFYRRCGVKDLALRINSLGDKESKQKYRDASLGRISSTPPHQRSVPIRNAASPKIPFAFWTAKIPATSKPSKAPPPPSITFPKKAKNTSIAWRACFSRRACPSPSTAR